MNALLEKKANILHDCKNQTEKIVKKLDNDNIKVQLQVIQMIEKLPNISGDETIRELKEYKQVRNLLKQLYIKVAVTIMEILNAQNNFSSDIEHSFNYQEPVEQILAAEYISLIPNAFIGGPMKVAVTHSNSTVRKIAIDYYETLPSDIKYSEIFPPDFRQIIRGIKSTKK